MYLFFKEQNINIVNIQTDNAMMFKQNNFVYSNTFNKWCHERNITRSFIPLNQPECDGCVERYHWTIDQELDPKFVNSSNLTFIKFKVREFMNYYNNERYLHFNELNHLSIEIYAIKFFNNINRV